MVKAKGCPNVQSREMEDRGKSTNEDPYQVERKNFYLDKIQMDTERIN